MGKVAMQTSSFISCEVSTEKLLLVASAPTATIVLLLFVFFSEELFFVLEGTSVRLQVRGGE